MTGAAPVCRSSAALLAAAAASVVLGTLAAPASTRVDSQAGVPKAKLPAQLWGVEVDRALLAELNGPLLARMRTRGVNALVVDRRKLGAPLLRRARSLAARARMVFIAPGARPCRAMRKTAVPCAVMAPSSRRALKLARARAADVVVVRVPRSSGLGRLRGRHAVRILALQPLDPSSFDPEAWSAAIATARAESSLDLAVYSVRRQGAEGGEPFDVFLGLLGATKTVASVSTTADTQPPSVPQGLTMISNSTTSISLAWNASTDNVGVAGYHLWRDGVRVASTTSTSYTYGGLACGKQYTLAVAAYDAAGNVSNKAEATTWRSTLACSTDTQPPSVPQGLTMTASTATSISLGWKASTDNVGVAGYNLWRDGAKVGSTASTSYTYSGLACGNQYALAVEAYDAAGNVSNKAEATTWRATLACSTDTQAPSMPQALTMTANTASSISLAWNASTDNVGVAGYRVWRDGVQVGSTGSTSYTSSGLVCGKSYAFAVAAYDAAGNVSTKAETTRSTAACPVADTQAPSVPQGLTMTANSASSISLGWNASSDNAGVAGYNLWRNGVKVASTASTSYTYSGLACGTQYTLAVEAYDAAGNVSNKAEATTWRSTTACSGDTQAPSAPQGVTVTASTESTIALAWSASTDNVGVAAYNLWRGGVKVASTALTAYTFSGLACGTSYTLAVDANDAAGNVSSSATVTRSTLACSAPPGPAAALYVSASGSDLNLCTSLAPCLSFSRAYQVAACGGVVEVAAGTYGDQVLMRDAAKDVCATGNQVLFRPAAGASVTVGLIRVGGGGGGENNIQPSGSLGASHLRFKDFTVTKEVSVVDASDVTYENITTQNFYLSGAQDVLIKGGDYSNCGSRELTCQQNYIDLGTSPQQQNARITIDGVRIHDYRIENAADHYECLIIFHVAGLTVRNTKFWNCQFYGILFGLGATGRGISNLTFENNWFDVPLDGNGLPVRSNAVAFRSPTKEPLTNVLFRFNSFHEDTGLNVLEDGGALNGSNVRVVANLLGNTACNGGVTYAYNVRDAATTCNGTEATTSSFAYANGSAGASFDAHLLAGSPALGFVTASGGDYELGTDVDGQTRSAPRDAGSHER